MRFKLKHYFYLWLSQKSENSNQHMEQLPKLKKICDIRFNSMGSLHFSSNSCKIFEVTDTKVVMNRSYTLMDEEKKQTTYHETRTQSSK